MSDKCFYCGSPAATFCDFILGWTISGYARVGPIEGNAFYACIGAPMFTCDMPACEAHNSYQGMFHASGKAGFSESIDYCPEHVGQRDHRAPPMLETEAETLRRAVRARAHRRMIREIAAQQGVSR